MTLDLCLQISQTFDMFLQIAFPKLIEYWPIIAQSVHLKITHQHTTSLLFTGTAMEAE